MAAFPTRITRASLGPKLEDAAPIRNPKQQVGKVTLNALFWAASGMSLVVPRATVIASWNTGGAVFDVSIQAEAWNPDGTQARPVLARTAAGSYTYTFASSYVDENEIAVPTVLLAARVHDQKALAAFADRIEARAWKDATNPLRVQIRLWDTAGTLVDAPFWLEVF